MENYLSEVAQILNVPIRSVKNYTLAWGELYDFCVTSPNEYAEMIRDIVKFY
jgi:thiamine monophosphate kinase